MGELRSRPPDRSAVALLATCVVVAGGVMSCAFVVLSSSTTPQQALLACAGCFAAVCVLLWLLRDKPHDSPTAAHFAWFREFWRAKQEVQYEVRRRRVEPPPPSTPPAPPTVDQLRELAENANTWVPSSGARPRRTDPS